MARVHYQKQRSREVATKAHKYLEKLHCEKGSTLEIDVRSRLSDKSTSWPEQDEKSDASSFEDETISTIKTKLIRENAFRMPDLSSRRTMLLFT